VQPASSATDALPDPAEWPHLPGAQRRFGLVVAATVAMGLLSALLVGWAVGTWAAAALYAALTATAGTVGYATALGRARRGGGRIDWALVRAVLDTRSEALAITDGSGRLICANEAWGTRCGGYPAPHEIDASKAGQDAVWALAGQARRDGQAHGEVAVTAEGRISRLRLSVRPAEAKREHLLWTLRRGRGDRDLDDARMLVEGAGGRWLQAVGVDAAVIGRDGRLLAAAPGYRALSAAAAGVGLGEPVLRGDTGEATGLRLADGSIRQARETVQPLEGGARLLLYAPVREELQSAALPDDRVAALLGSLPLGLAFTDRDGRFQYMNAAFEATAGMGGEAAAPHPTDLVVDEDKARVSDAVRRAASGSGKPRDLRVRLRARPEEEIILTVARASGLGDAAAVLSLRDAREQLKLERQIMQATKMQAVGQLAGGVAHDFNNILTAVIGYCDLMLMRHAPGDADFDDINHIRQNANRAANLVRQLLAFSRQQTLRTELLQVPDVIGELSHLLKRLLGERVALVVRHGRGLKPVRVDPGQLEQVIVNLAVNARDAMPDGGTLTIETRAVAAADVAALGHEMMPPADYAAITVSDTGTGIAPEIIGKIFEPFFTTKEFGKGTGLGLSTVYGVVKQTGGFIFADSPPGKGTSFTIYLPVESGAAVPVRTEMPRGGGAETWGSGTILVVEDEGMVRQVAERALTRKGYTVLTAGNGEEAMEVMAQHPDIDLLITDVVMPTMDGPTLVGHARLARPDLPVIFMSGYAEEQLRKSIDVPGVAFLPKPFSVQELGQAVQAALGTGG
jgi:two-component system, cell cycle sensor histidine kinase and response regulator CckA